MPNRRQLLAAVILLPLLLAGCKINTINSFPTNPAHVRVVNLVPDVAAINVTLGGSTIWSGLQFEASTDYVDVDNTRTTFTVTVPGAGTTLTQADYNLTGQVSYTLAVFGDAGNPSSALLADTPVFPNAGNFGLRFANAGVGSLPIDVYVTAPGVDITTVSPTSVGIVYGTATNEHEFNTGTVQIRAVQNGTLNLVYDSGPVTFADQSATNVLFYTRGSSALLNLSLMTINPGGPRSIANSQLARALAVNAASQTASTNVFLDGNGLVTGLAYPVASVYNTIPAASSTFTFEDAATPGATIGAVSGTLVPATDSSVVLMGFAGATHAFLLTDNNLPPPPNNAGIRYVNASPDLPAMDVLVNGVKQVGGIASGTASNVINVATGTATIVFADSASGATLLTLNNLTIGQGQVATIYAVGPASQLTSITVLGR